MAKKGCFLDLKSKLFSLIIVSACFLGLFFLTACSSGGNIFSAPTPEEQEVIEVVNFFSQAIEQNNKSKALSYLDSNLQYRWGDALLGYSGFSTKLANFYESYELVSFSISNHGVSIFQATASLRATLEYVYRPIEDPSEPIRISETIEMQLEKVPSEWGIVKIYRYDSEVGESSLSFPPL